MSYKEIADYQKEIEQLKHKLAHKTALLDKLEVEKEYHTRLLNQKDVLIAKLEEDQCNHVKEKHAWAHREAALLEQVDLCKAITQAKKMTEDAQEDLSVLEELIKSVYSERNSKRQRDV